MVELLGLDHERIVDLLEHLPQHLYVVHRLGIALLHRQLEVEHGLLAVVLAEPVGNHVDHPRRLVHHVAHQPVGVLLAWPPDEAVVANVLDLAGIHQGLGHGAVVHRGHHHATAHQLIGPAARAGAQIDGLHAGGEAQLPLFPRHEHIEGLFQLEAGAARGVRRAAQARNAHVEFGVVEGVGVPQQQVIIGHEEGVEHRTVRRLLLGQDLVAAQRLAQRHRELAAEGRELLRLVGVGRLHPQIATDGIVTGRLYDGGNPIGEVQILQLMGHHQHLADEDELTERQLAGQQIRLLLVIQLENHVTAVVLDPGEAVALHVAGSFGDLCRRLFLKTRAAIKQQIIHFFLQDDSRPISEPPIPT